MNRVEAQRNIVSRRESTQTERAFHQVKELSPYTVQYILVDKPKFDAIKFGLALYGEAFNNIKYINRERDLTTKRN